MTEIQLYTGEFGDSELKLYEIEGDREVVDFDGNRYEVSEELYNRVKRSMRSGVERPVIETENGVSGLFTPAQRGYYRHDDEEKKPENDEKETEKPSMEDFVDDTVLSPP